MRDEVVNALVAVAQLAFALAGIVLMALYDERYLSVTLCGMSCLCWGFRIGYSKRGKRIKRTEGGDGHGE